MKFYCLLGYTKKLMRFNWPKAKIHFKSDSNCLLINFFDLIPAVQSTRRDDSIQIRTKIISKIQFISKSNRNRSKLTDFFDINWLFHINWLFRSLNLLFRSYNWLFQSFNWLFQSLNWYFNQNRSKIDRNRLNFDQNRDRRLKFDSQSAGLESESSAIWCRTF